MAFSDFIQGQREEIMRAFEAFARTMMAAGPNMVPTELRDHAEEMLTAIVSDMETDQSRSEQADKAKGLGSEHAMAPSGHLHADARIRHGFTPAQVLAEFRALRASVLRLYEKSGDTDLAGVRRFNESIDELLTESITRYTRQTDLYRDQFIGILGHDLRDPLNGIAMGATLLTMTTEADHRSVNVAAGILRSAHRMGRMINDLLDMTVLRLGGEIPLKRAHTNLEQLCREVILEVQAANPTAVVGFTSSGDLGGEWDRERLAQVLSNLVGNAVQHGDGSEVALRAAGETSDVVVTVHNSGTPIPAQLLPVIFDPLVRNTQKRTDRAKSIGLGLFIANAIVATHGGDLSVTSSEGEGTTFTARLPRKPPLSVS